MELDLNNPILLKAHYKKIGSTKRSRLVDWEADDIDALLLVCLLNLLPRKMTLDPPYIFPEGHILKGFNSIGGLKVGRSTYYSLWWIKPGYCKCAGVPFNWKGGIPLIGYVDFTEFDKKFVLQIKIAHPDD